MLFLGVGGQSKPARSASWEAGQKRAARLMRDDEAQEDGAWSSAVTTSLDKHR